MKPDVISKLSSLNALLAIASGSGPECQKQVQAAIDFREAYCKHRLCTWDISHSAKHLVNIHMQGREGVEVVHWHIETPFLGSLWLHAMLIERLKQARAPEHSIFLITGLRAAMKAGTPKWGPKQAQRYKEYVHLVQDTLVAELAYLSAFQIICV